jgi:hypothetical protein
VPLDQIGNEERRAALSQLEKFAEDRYLHQTVVRGPGGDHFYEDLPQALAAHADPAAATSPWRIHFHVPIYLARFGALETTQEEIVRCLTAARDFSRVGHFEVETYAWSVLPSELQQPRLADGIAEEICWFDGALTSIVAD